MRHHAVTGGAGFIASTLIDRLLAEGDRVLALDDLSRGRRAHVDRFADRPGFRFVAVDCADLPAYRAAMVQAHAAHPIDEVWHLAANSDIPAGIADPTIDLDGTFRTTFNTVLILRDLAIPALRFASSSAIYGDLGEAAIREEAGPLEPISNYGAMKLASEAQIRAAVEAFLPRADIFRFPNVVGVPATHGVMLDFVRKLKATPEELDVLGDGTQRKAYLHVEELVAAMLFIRDRATARYNVFNIGPRDDGITVSEIAGLVRDRVAPAAALRFGESARGWVGDVPRFRYDTSRLAALGWLPTLDSRAAIRRALDEIVRQEAGSSPDRR
ncbi:NAD-dependent epimerase/dehydratase family protein [Methylobacterium oryzihabitans]|uniref:NAD-dependent epimerase/dehydratase family protein n=1 Tax=Methylobacterium oryzihabitans TaxID=2499852 RepID=A0A3S3U7Q3_9HYPH|nr:NAD-dependent epimerase/dehydratase family protein [Methylobacterium oryzihabitans]RVU17532.1 NAD-dependent epimerase/dehydratase family protein [Methylobacterium oryzihabitans]